MVRQQLRDDEAPTRRRRGPHSALLGGVALLAAFALGFAIASLHPDSRPEPPPVLIASDTAADPDPLPFWGALECASESRYRWLERGGDPQPTGTGRPQGNTAFRQLTVLDGDDFFGERCELGANDNQGPVAFYREGDHRITYASFRLPGDFPLSTKNWQGVLQMKQAQTADNGGGTPVLSLGAYDGEWLLFRSGPGPTDVDQVIWRAPASKQLWTRFRIEALYSQDPGRGWIEVQVDLDGDGNLEDEGERSPRIQTNTLKREVPGDEHDGLRAGDSIPSHLRAGIYHDERIACPPPSGCSVGVDNVQVLRPRGE